MKFRRFFFW